MVIAIYDNLKKAITEYDAPKAESLAREVIRKNQDLIKALDALTDAVRQVGEGFGKGELFLPDIVGAAEAMTAATPILEEEIKKRGVERESLGSVVIGTVYGDIHTIGKTMVATMLTVEGFTVHDAGINVSAEQFLERLKQHEAEILAMSAILTTTAQEQRKVIETLKKEGLRDKIKIMVGGGAITQEFSDSIGADGYDPTAPGAAKLARRLIGK